jgi:hypothetical protein
MRDRRGRDRRCNVTDRTSGLGAVCSEFATRLDSRLGIYSIWNEIGWRACDRCKDVIADPYNLPTSQRMCFWLDGWLCSISVSSADSSILETNPLIRLCDVFLPTSSLPRVIHSSSTRTPAQNHHSSARFLQLPIINFPRSLSSSSLRSSTGSSGDIPISFPAVLSYRSCAITPAGRGSRPDSEPDCEHPRIHCRGDRRVPGSRSHSESRIRPPAEVYEQLNSAKTAEL